VAADGGGGFGDLSGDVEHVALAKTFLTTKHTKGTKEGA
jgi:hypothetical protein